MAFEQKDMQGALFRNDRKEKETHPDHTGTATIRGQKYYISAWIKEGRNGRFFSLSFKPEMSSARGPEAKIHDPAPARGADDDFGDDDIPF